MTTFLKNLSDRIRRRYASHKISMIALAVILVSFIVDGIVYVSYGIDIEHQNEINKRLEAEIHLVDNKIVEVKSLKNDKEELLSRMLIVDKLKKSEGAELSLLAMLSDTSPDLRFSKLIKQGDKIRLQGNAQTEAALTKFLFRLRQLPSISDVKLSKAIAPLEEYTNRFTVTFRYKENGATL